MSERVKLGIIGAGGWGARHARVFSARDDVDVCAFVGRTREKTEARAASVGAHAYTSIAEMLSAEKPDLVSLCLPNKNHFDATLEVIRAGVPLFVEKPLVFEVEQADRLLDEAEQRGLFFAINFNHRYAKPVVMAREAIEAGRLGPIVFATWRFGGEGGDCMDHDNLIETQCHGFDMLEHLCGPVQSVCSQMASLTGKGPSTVALSLAFECGAVGSLVGSYNVSYAYPGTHLLEVAGTEGRVLVEDTVRRYSFSRAGSETAEVWQAGYFNDTDREFHKTFDAHAAQIIAAFKRGDEPPVHARAGRRALLCAQAAIAFFRLGTRVDIKGVE
jgi:myo-inositol 2-dehydrogenase/D-chiro-inositol 1-dehydrogenase